MQDDENNRKKDGPPPIRISQEAMNWIYEQQEERRKSEHKRPSAAAIIDELIAYRSGESDNCPTKSNVTPIRNVVQDTNAQAPVDLADISHTLQAIESKIGIDYERIEKAVTDALRRMDIKDIGAEFERITGATREGESEPGSSGKGNDKAPRRRGLA